MAENTLADTVRQAIRQPRSLQVSALPLFYPIVEALGLRQVVNQLCPTQADLDLGLVLLGLVLNRLLAPRPLYQVNQWVAQSVLCLSLDLDPRQWYDQRLGRALDALYAHLGELWARLVIRAIQVWQLDLSILHWDITSFYFTGAYTDSRLLRRGYSRDQRPDSKQINLEADVTHGTRVPIGYRVLPGQTADITTPPEHLAAWLRLLARPELVALNVHPLLVSDCKLLTPEAVQGCAQHQLFYLGPLADGLAVRRVLRSVSEDELAQHELAYRPKRQAQRADFIAYRGVWRAFTFQVKGLAAPEAAPGKTERFSARVLVVWSAGKARLDVQKRRTYLKRLLDGLERIRRQLNRGRYAARDYVVEQLAQVRRGNPAKRLVSVELQGSDGQLRLSFHLDRERVAAAQALDGRYALATNAEHLSADAALSIFKAQDDVEKQFSAVKGPLAVRPMFLHTDERIEGLVCVNLLALLVRAILGLQCQQAGLRLSLQRLLAEFATWQAIDLTLRNGEHVVQLTTPSRTHIQVLNALGVPSCERYLTTLPVVQG